MGGSSAEPVPSVLRSKPSSFSISPVNFSCLPSRTLANKRLEIGSRQKVHGGRKITGQDRPAFGTQTDGARLILVSISKVWAPAQPNPAGCESLLDSAWHCSYG